MNISERLQKFLEIHPRIRRRFPLLEKDSLGNQRTYLNCGAGTFMVDFAVAALEETSRFIISMPGNDIPAEVATRDLHASARDMAADFINAAAGNEISFHFSTSAALFNLAYAFQSRLDSGNNIIVTDLDHMSNVSPWETVLGAGMGLEVRRTRVNHDYQLDTEHLLSLVDENTRVVALTMAGNAFGSIVPVKEVVAGIRAISPECAVCVDAVHHAVHGPIDVRDLDCDFLALSGYKIFGPMLGVLWGKKKWLDTLIPYRVESARDVSPNKYEQGIINNAALAAFTASLEFLLWLEKETAPSFDGEERSRVVRFRDVMSLVEAYGQKISDFVLHGMEKLAKEKFCCLGVTDRSRLEHRDPTFGFEIMGVKPVDVKQRLWQDHKIHIGDGSHYSATVFRVLPVDALCRASFCLYDTLDAAEVFITGLDDLITKYT